MVEKRFTHVPTGAWEDWLVTLIETAHALEFTLDLSTGLTNATEFQRMIIVQKTICSVLLKHTQDGYARFSQQLNKHIEFH